MRNLPLVVPQSEVVTSSNTGANQLVVHAKLSRPTRHISGLIIRFAAAITGTAPGTARGISQLFHDIQITNDGGVLVGSIDGQALGPAVLDSIGQNGNVLQLAYQAFTDTVTAATTVTATGIYTLVNDFPGNYLTLVANLNAATSTGYTAVASASYTLSLIVLESQDEATPHLLKAEYVTNTSKFTSKYSARYATIAADNAELSTILTALNVGGVDFTALQAAMAEEAFNATIQGSTAVAGAAFAGLATKGATNPQTGNQWGMGRFAGVMLSPINITFNSSPTFYVVQRVPLVPS